MKDQHTQFLLICLSCGLWHISIYIKDRLFTGRGGAIHIIYQVSQLYDHKRDSKQTRAIRGWVFGRGAMLFEWMHNGHGTLFDSLPKWFHSFLHRLWGCWDKRLERWRGWDRRLKWHASGKTCKTGMKVKNIGCQRTSTEFIAMTHQSQCDGRIMLEVSTSEENHSLWQQFNLSSNWNSVRWLECCTSRRILTRTTPKTG